MKKESYKNPKFTPFKVRKDAKVKRASTDLYDYEIITGPARFQGKKVTKGGKTFFAVSLMRSRKGKNKFEIMEAEYVLGASQRLASVRKYEKAALKDYRMRTRGF